MRLSGFVMLLVAGIVLAAGVSQAGNSPPDSGWWDQDYKWCPDPPDDAVGGDSYEVLGIGYAIVNGYLVVCVDTNFPITGLTGPDSYQPNPSHFSPGDLYINVGGMFQMGNGSVWGVATTPNDPGVDRTSDPNDGPWETILDAGDLFHGAGFATGTFEGYPTGTPSDGNDGDGVNDYPTLIMNYQAGFIVGTASGFHYDAANTDYYYYVDLAFMNNFEGGTLLNDDGSLANTIQLTWAMECGNDLAEYKIVPDIPEPTTVALVSAGIAALAAKRRRGIL